MDAITIIGECKALVPLCQILTLMDSAVSPSPAKVPAKKRKAKRGCSGRGHPAHRIGGEFRELPAEPAKPRPLLLQGSASPSCNAPRRHCKGLAPEELLDLLVNLLEGHLSVEVDRPPPAVLGVPCAQGIAVAVPDQAHYAGLP